MNFNAVNTKIKAMRAKLLSAADYQKLCAAVQPRSTAKASAALSHSLETGYDFRRSKNFSQSLPITDFARALSKISAYLDNPLRGYLRKIYVPALTGGAPVSPPPRDENGSLKRIFGTEADLRNILFVYRLKKFHNTHGDAVFPFLNPHGLRLHTQEISRLAHAKNLHDFAEITASGVYGGIFGDFARAEQKISHAVRREFQKEYRRENFAVVCGYLHALHLETKNIRAINHGAANGLSSQEIFSLLHV